MKQIIKIYSAGWCQSCVLAKKLLNELNQPYKEIDIEKEGISRQDLMKLTGGMSVPQIVINGESIGGLDKLIVLNQNGTLKKMLEI